MIRRMESVRLAEHELARRDDGGVIVRAGALRIDWTFADLTTATWHTLRARFSCSIRAADSSADRAMLAEVLLRERDVVTAADVSAHFGPALRSAIAQQVEKSAAEELVAGQFNQQIIEQAKSAAQRVAFACGLEMLPPFDLEMTSPSLDRHRLEQVERLRAQERAAGQVEHLRRAGELLRQFQELRQHAPELPAGAVLQQLSPADRGAALETTLVAGARGARQQTLYAAAGPFLVRVARPSDDRRNGEAELIELPTTLGPLRSVQAWSRERRVVVGARAGVMLFGLDDSSADAARRSALGGLGSAREPTCFFDPELQSAHGFNRAIAWRGGSMLLASHSEGGIVAWNINSPERTRWALRAGELAQRLGLVVELPRMGPKNLCAVDDTSAVLSMGSRVVVLDGEEPRLLEAESASEVVDILELGEVLLIVHADGLVCHFHRHSKEVARRDRYGSGITAAGVLPWMDSGRLLLACEGGAIDCVGLDDQLVTRYVSSHRGVRMVAASADLVAAVSPDRQRLILWNSWDSRAPAAEVYITGKTRHRVADVAFG